jgi:hypothetical protein
MNRSRTYVLLVVFAALLGQETRVARGDEQAVEAGRQALRGKTDFPWYDAERDAVRRIDVYPPSDVSARKSKWQLPNRTTPPWVETLVEVIGWIFLGILLGGVLYIVGRALLIIAGNWQTGSGLATEDASRQGDIDRIESLPFQLKTAQTDLLAQARRYYEAGEFGQAIIYFYSYQLVQLDRHRLIRLAKGKTNRQYLREVRAQRDLWDLLSRSMIAFEDVFFGHHALQRDRFESCWRRLDDFHQQLAQAAE